MSQYSINTTQMICSSINDFAINVEGHDIHPVQIQPGPFNSYYALVDASDFTLMIRQVEHQYCEAGQFRDGSHGAAFMSSQGNILYNGRKYRPGEKLVTEGRELDSILSTNLRMVTCFIHDSRLQRYFTEEELELFTQGKQLINARNKRISCDNVLADYLNELTLNLTRRSLVVSNSVIYEDLCEDIYLKMYNFVTDTNEDNCINIKPKHRLELLKKALVFIHDNDDANLRVSDVATFTNTSQRNLQKLFEQYLGTSPKSYLIGRRLHRVRLALLEADPLTQNVRGIAEHFGVIHHGNFANDYFEFFGEYPKDTLKKKKGTHTVFHL